MLETHLKQVLCYNCTVYLLVLNQSLITSEKTSSFDELIIVSGLRLLLFTSVPLKWREWKTQITFKGIRNTVLEYTNFRTCQIAKQFINKNRCENIRPWNIKCCNCNHKIILQEDAANAGKIMLFFFMNINLQLKIKKKTFIRHIGN